MLLKLVSIFSLICIPHCVISKNLESSVETDIYRRLLEKKYVSGNDVVCKNCGEPLLLTPLIEDSKLEEARATASVDPEHFLPGIESYAGYLTVNKEYNANLYFWYFPVIGKPIEDTPLILWLEGGPGASSLFGTFVQIGPFSVTDNITIEAKEFSWSKDHSLLFIDNPVGTGFSFTDDARGYATNQTTIGENLYSALQQFMTLFPELRQAPLFIAGESYAGKHNPSLAIQIHWNKYKDEHINLQGLAIGNGFIDPITLLRYSYAAREIGLVDDKTADKIKDAEAEAEKTILSGNLRVAHQAYFKVLELLHSYSNLPSIYNIMNDNPKSPRNHVKFLEQSKIRRALHVGNTSFDNLNMLVYDKLLADMMNSAKPWVEELFNHYKVMVFNGHLDFVVPYHASVNTYKSFTFSGSEEYKKGNRWPWSHDGDLAGYYKRAGNFMEVMVRGSGHSVTYDKPAEALKLISAFALDEPLPYDSEV